MGILLMPVYIYAAFKECAYRLSLCKDRNHFGILLALLMTALVTPFAYAFWVLLTLYKMAVEFYLAQEFGADYRGAMEGIDVICCNQDNCIPHLVLFVEFKDGFQQLIAAVQKNIDKIMATQHEKMFYSRGEFMGYHFYYHQEVAPDDLITIMEDDGSGALSEQEYSIKSIPYQKARMPLEDTKLFEVVICPQNVVLASEPHNPNIYALAYRIHHCVGDGKSILHYFKCVLSDSQNIIVKTPTGAAKFCIAAELEKAKEFVKNVRIKEFPLMSADDNILRGYKLTEERIIAWFSDSGTEYMDKIRKLRKTIKGVTFLDVFNTCLVSSLYDYYKKYTTNVPKSIIGGVVLKPEVTCFAYGNSNFSLHNEFSAASFTMPIDVESDNNNKLLTRLKLLQNEYTTVKRSMDVQFNYYMAMNILNVIPSSINRFMSKFLQITIGISSLPGCDAFTIFGGRTVKDFILLPPNSPGTGLHIIIYTYGGHLRIGLTVDRGVIRRYEEAKEIVDGIIKYLDDLSTLCDDIKL